MDRKTNVFSFQVLEHADLKETGLEVAKLEKAWEGMSSELAGFDEAGVADMSV